MLGAPRGRNAYKGPLLYGQTLYIDNGTLGAIVGLGLTPSAIRPGVIAASGGVVTATFPIAEIENGVIRHAGGIALTSGDGTKLALTRYKARAALTARAPLAVHLGLVGAAVYIVRRSGAWSSSRWAASWLPHGYSAALQCRFAPV